MTAAQRIERFNVPGVLRMLEAEAAGAFQGERTKIELVARLIRQQADEIECLRRELSEWKRGSGHVNGRLLAEIERLRARVTTDNSETLANALGEIERLQRALAFWLPGVPAAADDPEIARRAGDDASLLAGYQGEEETDAEDLGWIHLREAP